MASKRRSKLRLEKQAEKPRKSVAPRDVESRAADVRALFVPQTEHVSPSESDEHTKTVKSGVASAQTQTASITRSAPHSAAPVYETPSIRKEALRPVVAPSPYKAAKRLDLGARERERKTEWWLGPVLIFGALLMLGLGWLHIERAGLVSHPVGHTSSTMESLTRETSRKIQFYRNQLGHRLNRDRVGVEISNSQQAPALGASNVPKAEASMMRGAPLMQEGYVDLTYGSRTRVEPVAIDHPDARIQYGLQEEQDRKEFDRRVQKQYLNDFIENARLDGVKVTVDGEGNVTNVEPIAGHSRGDRSPGAIANPGTSH